MLHGSFRVHDHSSQRLVKPIGMLVQIVIIDGADLQIGPAGLHPQSANKNYLSISGNDSAINSVKHAKSPSTLNTQADELSLSQIAPLPVF